jgi:hypothetical protein
MADQAEMTTASTGYEDKPLRKQYTLFFVVAAQFSYVGAQVAIASYFINYFEQARPDLSRIDAQHQGANFYAIAQGLFAIGRFSAAGLMYITKPRYILLAYQSLIMVFIAAAIGTNTGTAITANWGGVAMLMIVLFFESCIFPTIFTLSLRGLGRHTKRGASFLVASVCGGAVIPAILGNVADKTGTRVAMVVPLAFFVIAWSFPIYLNIGKKAVSTLIGIPIYGDSKLTLFFSESSMPTASRMSVLARTRLIPIRGSDLSLGRQVKMSKPVSTRLSMESCSAADRSERSPRCVGHTPSSFCHLSLVCTYFLSSLLYICLWRRYLMNFLLSL